MNHNIPCEVIQDLLPLYIDGITTNKTNQLIKEHLKLCNTCRERYMNMTSSLVNSQSEEKETQNFEVDYLKKVKNKNRTKVFVGIIGAVSIIFMILFLKLFVWGYEVNTYSTDIVVKDNIALILGTMSDPSSVYDHYKIVEEDGEKRLVIYASRPSFWNKNGDFQITYNMDGKKLNVNGDRITSEGKITTKKAYDLFAARNPYIGNMSANEKLTRILEIPSKLGPYLNSLQTEKKPYGWTIEFQEKIPKSSVEKFNATMKSYSYLLLALIDNCSELSWEYATEGESHLETITIKDASNELGSDIKSYSTSVEKVQELLNLIGAN